MAKIDQKNFTCKNKLKGRFEKKKLKEFSIKGPDSASQPLNGKKQAGTCISCKDLSVYFRSNYMLKEMELTEILSLVSGHLNFLVLSMIYLKDARKMPLICTVNI